MEIILAKNSDSELLADMFIAHVGANREYISHGELQMGVGVAKIGPDGDINAALAPDGRKMWMKYITEKISSDNAVVYKAVEDTGSIVGFCVADIEEDGADPFGMVCDVFVKESAREGGIGGRLLDKAVEWLHSKGIADIYLESGKNNHSAHSFFKKRGFVNISEIFKLF